MKNSHVLLNSSNINCDIIVLTETWLSSDKHSAEYFDSRLFSVARRDRVDPGKGRGGGVLIAVKNHIMYRLVDLSYVQNAFLSIDLVGVELTVKCAKVVLLVIYLPPDVRPDLFAEFLESLSDCPSLLNSNTVVMGDFNAPKLSGTLEALDPNSLATDRESLALIEFSALFDLVQYNKVLNDDNRSLDLVYTNMSCTVTRALESLVGEDIRHPSLNVCLVFDTLKYTNQFNKHIPQSSIQAAYNFRKCDPDRLQEALASVNWALNRSDNVDITCDSFYDKLYSILDECVPKNVRRVSTYPPWFNRGIIADLKLKNHHHKMYKKLNSDFHWDQFKSLRSATKHSIAEAHGEYLQGIELSLLNEPSRLWNHINNMRKDADLPCVMHSNGVVA